MKHERADHPMPLNGPIGPIMPLPERAGILSSSNTKDDSLNSSSLECYRYLHLLQTGLAKTRVFKKKTQPGRVFLGFIGFHWVFLGFIGFF
jgi:hypothetical protein